ncbi:MAG TPA: DegT/DnrJ/EryC1/StrS family aminotransferase [Candidatus Peribacteraceae bacterium]|nr:DegT/DnrJ/EryC1/StrS family aminotransferase [Candidatus Peribacteraceae bacterium]
MNVPFLDLQAQYRSIKHEVDPAIQSVLDTSAYVLGPAVEQFEKDFASYCEARHCVCVNSGTSALALLMQAYDIGPGDEVITVANTFFATAEAISELGAVPVLVDCDAKSALMNPAAFEAAVTKRTKAVIPVHLYGQCAEMDAIIAIARTHNILVFEDACQAHGATYKGRKAGGLADGAAFSFYPGKNLGAYGEGGAVTTNTDMVAETIRMLRDHGSPKKYHHSKIGWNERMDGIQGAVLGVKLKHLDEWNAKRREHAELYRKLLPETAQAIAVLEGNESAYHLFVVRVQNRDVMQRKLTEAGIATGIHYPVPIHLQPAYAGHWEKNAFPNAELLADEILSLPMFPELTDEHIRFVCETLAS